MHIKRRKNSYDKTWEKITGMSFYQIRGKWEMETNRNQRKIEKGNGSIKNKEMTTVNA